jgi:hypothetical protein
MAAQAIEISHTGAITRPIICYSKIPIQCAQSTSNPEPTFVPTERPRGCAWVARAFNLRHNSKALAQADHTVEGLVAAALEA